jgi:hypothetical protein
MSGVTRTLFGGSKSSQSSSSTNELDPEIKQAYLDNYARAQNVANNLQYGDDFYAGADYLRNAINNNVGISTLNNAANALQNMVTFETPTINRGGVRDVAAQPTRAARMSRGSVRDANAQRADAVSMNRGDVRDVTAQEINSSASMDRGDVRDVTGGSFLNANLDAYMNPYLQMVAGNTLSDMERARQMQMMQDQYSAGRANAFGGSRQGVFEAESNRNYFDRLGNTITDLYAKGFDAAAGLAGQDLNRALQASLANQGMDFDTSALNAQLRQDILLQNAANNLQAQLANQGMDFETSALNAQMGQQAALQYATNTLQAQLANQGMDFETASLNAQLMQQAALQDAMNNLQAQISNQGMDFRVLDANQQAAVQAQAQRIAAAQLLAQTGAAQSNSSILAGQTLQNLGMTDINLALMQQGLLNDTLGLNPAGGSGSISTSTSSGSGSSNNGIFRPFG